MSHPSTLADTPPTRTDLRLVVLAQWVRAGLDLVRGATTTGRGLVGGAVALWRLAQAVRLAILLARRLADAAGVASPITERAAAEAGLAPAPSPFRTLEDPPANAAALRRALDEIAAAISNALGPTRRPLPARPPSASAVEASELPRPVLARTPPRVRRSDRPPGPARPGRRRWRPARALKTTPPPIATLAVGRAPLGGA